jgi:hypothetical protein
LSTVIVIVGIRVGEAFRMLSKVMIVIPLVGLLCLPAIAAPPAPLPADTFIPVARPIPSDTVISLQRMRGGCETAVCPTYRILIFDNGDVIWHGRFRVARPGVLVSHIEPDQIRMLIQDFESIDFFHLENIYGSRGADGCQSQAPEKPYAFISLSMGGLSRTLGHYDGCVGDVSEKLAALENSIDQAVDAAQWITGKPRAKKR